MPVVNGFDRDRDQWSSQAAELLFPDIARVVFHSTEVDFVWKSPTWKNRLDKEYGVDALIITPRRRTSVAIRVRSARYFIFHDITIRYESLQTLGKLLESQKSIARFMFYAWADTDQPTAVARFIEWHVIDLQRLIDLWLTERIMHYSHNFNNDQSSTFVAFKLQDLTANGLLWSSQLYGSNEIVRPTTDPPPVWGQQLLADSQRQQYEIAHMKHLIDKMMIEGIPRSRRGRVVPQEALPQVPLALPDHVEREDYDDHRYLHCWIVIGPIYMIFKDLVISFLSWLRS